MYRCLIQLPFRQFNVGASVFTYINRMNIGKQARWKSSYLHHVGEAPLRYTTVGKILEETADRWPDRQAVVSTHQNQSLTFSQLLTQADRLAVGLANIGIENGDRIGVWLPNRYEWVTILMAAARGGFIPVAINPAYEESEISYCINKVGMKAIICQENTRKLNCYKILRELIPELDECEGNNLKSYIFPSLRTVIMMDNVDLPGTLTFKSLLSDVDNLQNNILNLEQKVKPDDGYILHFTSGTTGNPKAALVSHFSVVNNSYLLGKRTELHTKYHKICVQVPIFHAFGTIISVMAAVSHGSTLVFPHEAYSPKSSANAILSEGCTVLHGTPTMYVDLINIQKKNSLQFTTPEIALTAGAPCSPHLFKEMKKILKVNCVKSIFGMTEATAAIFQSLPNESMEMITETVGHLHEHLEVKVVDEDGHLVPFGMPGELLVRGYSTMMEYWSDVEKTKETIGTDKWLRTGDQFTIHEDGYGKIVGRIKDLIIRGGENIYPKEIEDIINTHPAVLESQVFGVSDNRLNEEICVAVRLTEKSKVSLQDLNKHCEGKIASYKLPRILKIIEQFPKTASGKIQKYKLKELVDSGKL